MYEHIFIWDSKEDLLVSEFKKNICQNIVNGLGHDEMELKKEQYF